MEIDLRVPHESHLELWKRNDWRYAIFMGGRGNGRSGTCSRFALSQLFSEEYTRGAFMRAVRADIEATCWQELTDRIAENNIENARGLIQRDLELSYGRNSLMGFGFRASSGSLKARLKSLANFNFAWIEEMEEIGGDEFRQFDDSLRTVDGRIRIIGSTNPPPKNHWMIEEFFDLEEHPEAKGFYIPSLKDKHKHDTLFISGTYEQNIKNLDPATVTRYEGYKKTNPSYYWQQIVGLVPETVQGRIYSGWREIEQVPHEARLLGHGLDFGGGSAPDAIVSIYYHNGGYILDEKYYSAGNSYDTLIQICKMLDPAPIVADSAEQRMIDALRRSGVNIVETDKGPGSVEFGIKHVQGLKISYTSSSANLKREYENFAWHHDKDGNNKNIPDVNCKHKFGDHLLDGLRYFAMKMITAGADPQAQERIAMVVEERQREQVERVAQRIGV